ncbi:Mariner Mos1 transposase [Eumeta japonica]|uniref:Mariner Mos1 transposase n=1 Tax=Eumeta variegata TaxID=151549 RepID=A0A4C1UX16_EUMVA|nr:Mariner Mos1 transposase [Eumeta japonica]
MRHEPRKEFVVFMDWFKRFQSSNFDVKDEPRSRRSITNKVDVILEKVEHISSYAEDLEIDYEAVLTYLEKAGYTKKFDTWILHELTERNLMNRVLIC